MLHNVLKNNGFFDDKVYDKEKHLKHAIAFNVSDDMAYNIPFCLEASTFIFLSKKFSKKNVMRIHCLFLTKVWRNMYRGIHFVFLCLIKI